MNNEDHLTNALAKAYELRDQPMKWVATNKAKKAKQLDDGHQPIDPCYIVLPGGKIRLNFTTMTVSKRGVEIHARTNGWAMACRIHPGPTPSEPPADLPKRGGHDYQDDED